MARILIVGGGCKGRRFAQAMVEQGHAVRVSTRGEGGREAIEATGAECWIGTPDRLATLRGSLENVTIACWLLAEAQGEPAALAALHGSRLEFFLGQAIDTTARGLIYDVSSPEPDPARADQPGALTRTRVTPTMLAAGRASFESLTKLNSIPSVVLDVAPGEGADERWLVEACAAVEQLLFGRG